MWNWTLKWLSETFLEVCGCNLGLEVKDPTPSRVSSCSLGSSLTKKEQKLFLLWSTEDLARVYKKSAAPWLQKVKWLPLNRTESQIPIYNRTGMACMNSFLWSLCKMDATKSNWFCLNERALTLEKPRCLLLLRRSPAPTLPLGILHDHVDWIFNGFLPKPQ